MRKVLAASVGLLFMVAAIASCGGSGSSKNSSNSKDAEFTTLYNKSKDATFRVTYETHGSDGTVSDTWTVSQQGNKKAYIQKNSKTVVIDQTAYTCSDLDTQPSCDVIPGGADSANAAIAAFAGAYSGFAQAWAQEAASLGISKKSTETIAGRDADCREVTVAGAASGIAKSILNHTGVGGLGWSICIDKQTGVMLSVKTLGDKNDKGGIVATKFEDPKDEDFAVPTTTTTTEGGSTDTSGSGESTTAGDSTVTTAACPSGMTLPSLPSGMTYPAGTPCYGKG